MSIFVLTSEASASCPLTSTSIGAGAVASATTSETDVSTSAGLARGAWRKCRHQSQSVVNRDESGVAESPVAPDQDDRWRSSTTRGGAARAAFSGSAASPYPLLLGCALQPSAQNDPPAPPQTPDFLPTEAELTTWAVHMFLSGTGAVLALVLTTTVREATVRLLIRIRAA